MLQILYLVRHGKAVASHPEGDRHRALSAEGRFRIEGMLVQARQRDFSAELALSSPYLRAVQTRDLFAPVLAPRKEHTSTAFVPESDPEDALVELAEWEKTGVKRLALFTHNPFVTRLAELLLLPGSEEAVFHTPSILALGFDAGLAPRSGHPLWTLHP